MYATRLLHMCFFVFREFNEFYKQIIICSYFLPNDAEHAVVFFVHPFVSSALCVGALIKAQICARIKNTIPR